MSREERFDLLFSGEVTLSTADAVPTLCHIFKVSTEKAHRLLAQKSTLTIKRSLPSNEALSLQVKLEKRGIITRVEKVPQVNPSLDLIPIEKDQQQAATSDNELLHPEDEEGLHSTFDIGLFLHKALAILGIFIAVLLIIAFVPDEHVSLRRGLVLGLIILYLSSKRLAALRQRI